MAIPASQPTDTFLAACLAGRAKPEDAAAFIERWQATVTDGTPLQRYLGMTDPEWALYLQAENNIHRILADRSMKKCLAKPAPRRRQGWN